MDYDQGPDSSWRRLYEESSVGGGVGVGIGDFGGYDRHQRLQTNQTHTSLSGLLLKQVLVLQQQQQQQTPSQGPSSPTTPASVASPNLSVTPTRPSSSILQSSLSPFSALSSSIIPLSAEEIWKKVVCCKNRLILLDHSKQMLAEFYGKLIEAENGSRTRYPSGVLVLDIFQRRHSRLQELVVDHLAIITIWKKRCHNNYKMNFLSMHIISFIVIRKIFIKEELNSLEHHIVDVNTTFIAVHQCLQQYLLRCHDQPVEVVGNFDPW
jgi:hypothetical protein